MSKTIALFGGSFDPPHKGHFEITRRVARKRFIDEVWILPVFRHPFEKKLTPFSKRFRVCQKYFKNLSPKVKVKDTERRLGGTSWTSRLVSYLKKKHTRYQFVIVMGEDAWKERKKWKNFDFLKREVRFLVFPRGPKSPIPHVSSTEIRRGLI